MTLLLSLLQLFWEFFKIGAFTFGGGLAMLRLAQDVVLEHGWLEADQIIDFVALSESTPGPFAINMATYVGASQQGFWGAFFATLGVVLPSFIIILIVAHFYKQFQNSHIVKGLMTGLKPTAIGLIASAVISMGITVFLPSGLTTAIFNSSEFYISIAIFTLSLFLVFFKKVKIPPVLIICISALLGIAAGYIFDVPLT